MTNISYTLSSPIHVMCWSRLYSKLRFYIRLRSLFSRSATIPLTSLIFLIIFVFSRRVFLDGLVRAGTGSSVEVIVDLIKSRGLNGFETQIALLSLGNAKHTSDEAVKAAAVSNIYRTFDEFCPCCL